MNQILPCDWLPELARSSYLAHSGLHVPAQEKLRKNHITNPLLTISLFDQGGWILSTFFFFLRVYGPRLRLSP